MTNTHFHGACVSSTRTIGEGAPETSRGVKGRWHPSQDLKRNSSLPGGPEGKGVQGRRNGAYKSVEAAKPRVTGICTQFVLILSVGDWQDRVVG